MKKTIKDKLHSVFILLIIFICLFPNKSVLAENNKYPGAEVDECTWRLTWFGGTNLASGVTVSDCTYNEEQGWYEYIYNGTSYVVLAGAHRDLIGEKDDTSTGKGAYRDWIHYFNYYDTISFKLNGEVYNGIILDCCGASMRVAKGKSQILDVYTCANESSYSGKMKNYSGTEVDVTTSGVFPPKAGTTSSTARKNYILEIFKKIFTVGGDIFQIAIDSMESDLTLKKALKLTYTMGEIESDEDLNAEIQVADFGKTEDTNTITNVEVSDTIDNRKGQKETVYTKSTKIPVIPIDSYSSSIDKLDILDIDFYDKSNDNPNKFWKTMRNLVRAVSHSVLYISAALLLTMIIWRSILFVKSSLRDDPSEASESKKIMDNWLKSIILIVGVYVIMTLMMYFYQNILSIIMNGNNSNYLIRVNVENVYSFNTNVIGYLKYMTLNANSLSSFGYSILYFIVALFNLLWFGYMFVRIFIIGGLTIIAPLTAVMYMNGKPQRQGMHITNILHFRNWIILYACNMWIPLVIVFLQSFILHIV